VSPLEHGILDFTRFNPRSGAKEPITSDERLAPAIWNMASAAGKRVGVIGLWATYPAEPVNGLMVSDRLSSFLFKEESPPPGIVFPAAEEALARQALAAAESRVGLDEMRGLMPGLDEAEYQKRLGTEDPYGHPVSALRRILVETTAFDELARGFLSREPADLAVVYFQGTDSIGHVFAPFAPPMQPGISADDYARYHGVPEAFFKRIDDMLGEYQRLARQSGAVLMVASDHGFTWGEGRPTRLSSFAIATAAKWHRKEGVYLLWGPGIAPVAGHSLRGKVGQVCATLVSLLGLPSAGYLYGPALPGTPAPSATGRVDYRAYYKPSSLALAADPAGDAEALAKLKSLGYIGASEPTSAGKGGLASRRTAGSYNNEGLILRDDGRSDDAIRAFDKALELDPNLTSASWNLSDTLFASGRDLDRSDELLLRAFGHGLPEGTRFLVGRAISYQRNGKLDRSLKLMAASRKLRPDEPEVWLFDGRYRIESGDCPGARDDFKRAVGLAPNDAAAHASLGLAQLCLGDKGGARASFERSLQIEPEQPKLKQYLAAP
jgi:Flp pilus assembly protein TadD